MRIPGQLTFRDIVHTMMPPAILLLGLMFGPNGAEQVDKVVAVTEKHSGAVAAFDIAALLAVLYVSGHILQGVVFWSPVRTNVHERALKKLEINKKPEEVWQAFEYLVQHGEPDQAERFSALSVLMYMMSCVFFMLGIWYLLNGLSIWTLAFFASGLVSFTRLLYFARAFVRVSLNGYMAHAAVDGR